MSFLTGLNKENLTRIAREDVRKARAHLPPKESHLAFAQMYEFLKDKENAQKEYEAAYAVAADDPTNIRSLADFYCAPRGWTTPTPCWKNLSTRSERSRWPTAFGPGGNSP